MNLNFLNTLAEIDTIKEIIKILMGGSLTFIGLIFTSLGIILTMQDNWKTKAVRTSKEFKTFLNQNVRCVISSLIIFIFSILFLLIKDLDGHHFFVVLNILILIFSTISVCYYIVCIVFNYKKLIELKSDDTKPNFSFKSYGEEEDD